MATYAEQFTLSQDAGFKGRVQIACVRAANTVLANNTAQFVELARRVLKSPDVYAALAAQAIMSDATVANSAPTGAALTDAQLQSAVTSFLANLNQ